MGTQFSALVSKMIESVQPSYDGGVVNYMANQNFTGIHSAQFWQNWKVSVLHKGSYTWLIILGVFWALVLPLIVLTCWFFLYLKCSCSGNKVQRFVQSKVDTYTSKYPRLCCIGKSAQSVSIGHRGRKVYHIQLLCVGAVVILFCISICFAFAMNAPLQNMLESREQKSIKSSLISIVHDSSKFIVEGVDDARLIFNNITFALMDEVESELQIAITTFTDGLLKEFKVAALFEVATTLVDSLNAILTAMEHIHTSQTRLFAKMNIFMGTVGYARHEIVSRLPKVCPLLTSKKESAVCENLILRAPHLTLFMEQKNLNFDSSNSVLFVVQQFKLNISILARDVDNAKLSLGSLTQSIYDLVKKDLNLETMLGDSQNIWVVVKKYVAMFMLPMMDIVDHVESITKTVSNVNIGIFIVPGATLLLFLLIFGYLIYESITFLSEKYHTLDARSGIYELIRFDENGTKPTRKNKTSSLSSRFRQLRHSKKTKKVSHYSTIVICIIIIVPKLGVVGCFLVGSALQTELCRYFTTEKGRQSTDSMLDEYVVKNWDNWKESLLGSLDPDVQSIFNIPPPRYVYRALREHCSNASMGLLDAVQIRNIINVTTATQLPFVQNITNMGRTMAKETIGNLDVDGLMPKGIKPILVQAEDLTRVFVDSVDYQKSIVELQKSIMKISDPVSYFKTLDRILKIVSQSHPNNNEVIILGALSQNLIAQIPIYNELTEMVSILRKNFQVLQDTRTLNNIVRKLTALFNDVESILNNKQNMTSAIDPIYDFAIGTTMSRFVKILEKHLAHLESHVAKCFPLHQALSTFENNVCHSFKDEFNTFIVLYAFSLFLFEIALVVLFFHLRKIEHQKKTYETEC